MTEELERSGPKGGKQHGNCFHKLLGPAHSQPARSSTKESQQAGAPQACPRARRMRLCRIRSEMLIPAFLARSCKSCISESLIRQEMMNFFGFSTLLPIASSPLELAATPKLFEYPQRKRFEIDDVYKLAKGLPALGKVFHFKNFLFNFNDLKLYKTFLLKLSAGHGAPKRNSSIRCRTISDTGRSLTDAATGKLRAACN